MRTASRIVGVAMLAALPYLLLPRSVLAAAPSRRWTITGRRVEEFDSLDAATQRLLQRYAVRAGSLAVARQGKLLFARGYTWAEPDYPVTQSDSPFRLASVSKAFTAAVIYQLLQAKKLELSLPVFPWLGLDRAALPGQTVDPRLATITVQQLINHRGGWDSRAANFDPVFSMRRIARRLGLRAGPSSRDIARFMVGEPLQFTPGTQERYSNFRLRHARTCRTHDRSLRGVGPGSAARQPELGAQRRHGRHQQPCDLAAGRTRPLLRREHPQFWRRLGDG